MQVFKYLNIQHRHQSNDDSIFISKSSCQATMLTSGLVSVLYKLTPPWDPRSSGLTQLLRAVASSCSIQVSGAASIVSASAFDSLSNLVLVAREQRKPFCNIRPNAIRSYPRTPQHNPTHYKIPLRFYTLLEQFNRHLHAHQGLYS